MPYQEPLLGPRAAWLPRAIEALTRHHFLTATQLSAVVTAPVARISAALDAFVTDGLLARVVPSHGLTGPVPEPAYALTARGARTVVDAHGNPATAPSLTRTAFRLAHDLARNDFGLAIEALGASRLIDLVRYTTEVDEFADHAWLIERGRTVRVPLVADALVVTRAGDTLAALYVETDRGTVSIERMRRKYQGYLALWKSGGHTKRHGTTSMRVLTVCPDPARLRRLRGAALDATEGRGSGVLWFMLQEDVRPREPTRLLEPVCLEARADDESTSGLYPRTSRTVITRLA